MQQLALAHQPHHVAVGSFCDVLRGDQQRRPIGGKRVEPLPQFGPQDGVDARRRFVENEQRWRMQKGRRQCNATLHATRCVADLLRGLATQVHQFEHLGDSSPAAAVSHPVERRVVEEVLADRQRREEHGLLRQVPDALALLQGELVRAHSEGARIAFVGAICPGQETNGRRLATTRGSDQTHDRSGRRLEVEVADDPVLTEGLAGIVEL